MVRFLFQSVYIFLGATHLQRQTISFRRYGGSTRMKRWQHFQLWGSFLTMTVVMACLNYDVTGGCQTIDMMFCGCTHSCYNYYWRFNLVQLFLPTERSSCLRKMIVDLQVNVSCKSFMVSATTVFFLSMCLSIPHTLFFMLPRTLWFCRLLDLTVDVYWVKILQYRIFGPRKVWMMISAELFLR